MRFDVLTLFPEMFTGALGSSILRRAAEAGVASYHLHQIRDYSADPKHRRVDAPPYGGGPGMVMQCQPVFDAVRAAERQQPELPGARVVMTPTGVPMTQALVQKLAEKPRLVVLAGHYEGFDQRVLDELRPMEISLGDYVLSGGELPAMVLIDAVVRLLPGALGDAGSAAQDSFGAESDGLLEHPHYTRPAEWHGREVPAVLMSGDHEKIAAWRRAEAERVTRERRPDLLGLGDSGDAGLVVVRCERPGDEAGIAAVQREAFGGDGVEAELVDRLRERGELLVSVVAEAKGRIVGHAAVSEMELDGQLAVRGLMGLGPVGVAADWQGRGIGSQLVREAVEQGRQLGGRALFVLGEPAYYGPLGFVSAVEHGFGSDYGDGPAFQVSVLKPLREGQSGRVRYASAFGELLPPDPDNPPGDTSHQTPDNPLDKPG
ncbi:MAG: tRNA (guanosine(37)-N1)-methyltransferase TrmD [Planctomycetota bacterium]